MQKCMYSCLMAIVLFSCIGSGFSRHLNSIIDIQDDYLKGISKVQSKKEYVALIREYNNKIDALAKVMNESQDQYIAIKADVESGMIPDDLKDKYKTIQNNNEKIKEKTDEIILEYKVEPFAAYAMDEFLQSIRRITYLPIIEE